MPAKSKAQQRFMGMVHAVQKGELSPSKVSDKVKDVADNMSDSDAEDFASTKHKGKPEKVAKEVIKKIREILKPIVKESYASMFGEITKHMKSSHEVQAAKELADEYDIGKVLYVFRTNPRAFKQAIKEKMKEMKQFRSAKKLKEGNFDRGTSGLPRGWIEDYNKIVKKLSKGKGYGTLSKSDKQKVWATLGKKYNESVNEDRDYKDEYKKFQSSAKAKKYRAELNQYNRKKGTYGNKDGKDASHKGGKIAGFEKESTNRGRAEKSRLKKEMSNPTSGIMSAGRIGTGHKFSSPEAKTHVNKDVTTMSKFLGKASQQVIKTMMNGVKGGKYNAMDLARGIQVGPANRTHFGEVDFIQQLWNKVRDKFRRYSPSKKLS